MNYEKCEWMIKESKSFNWNGFYATCYNRAHCSTCDGENLFYKVEADGRTIYGRCMMCNSYWLNRHKYNRATSFKQNTIKRAMGIA